MRFKKIIVCIRVEFDSIMTWRQFSTYRNKSLEKRSVKTLYFSQRNYSIIRLIRKLRGVCYGVRNIRVAVLSGLSGKKKHSGHLLY